MDWMTFVVELAKALAWPVVAGGALLYLRGPIHEIAKAASRQVDRIEKAEGFGVKVELAKQAEQAQEVAADAATRLASESLPPDERAELVKQLKDSLAKARRLQAISGLVRPDSNPSLYESMQYWGKELSPSGKQALKKIVDVIGAETIAQVAASGGTLSVKEVADQVLRAAKRAKDSVPGLGVDAIAELRLQGIVDDHDGLTPLGTAKLLRAAQNFK